MRKYKIFISGVQKELKAERRAIKDYIHNDALLTEYFDIYLFEDAPAKSKVATKTYLDELHNCDIFVCVLGLQYGVPSTINLSPTEIEFREAKNTNKNILIYIKGLSAIDKSRELGIQKLIKEIKNASYGYCYKRFSNKPELIQQIYASLICFLREEGIVGRSTFDEQICSRATMKDIDEEKIRWFLNMARSVRKYPLNRKTPVVDVLTHLSLMRDGKLTNAAVLLFGKNPNRIFLQAEVKCLQFFGTKVKKPFTSYKEVRLWHS